MSLILNIDTSLQVASVSFARDGAIIASAVNNTQKDHAGFLHTAIQSISDETGISLDSLDAVAVTEGPGSYTGLRVGMASAKGLCYALNKPFITVGTLPAMAHSMINAAGKFNDPAFFCPMIDARRMEVYTAIYNYKLEEITAPCAMILDNQSLSGVLHNNQVYFAGSGAKKWQNIINHHNALFLPDPEIIASIARLSFQKNEAANFSNLGYSEPLYVKEFYSN